MSSNKIGIVTVLYNSEKVLDDFFETLKKQTYKNFTLYIVDNNSPDNSLSKAKQLADKAWFETKIIKNTENYGVAKGNNQGIISALYDGCDYVLLSNNDVYLEPDTIRLLLEEHINVKADLSIPKIYFFDNPNIWCAGGRFTIINYSAKQYGYNKPDSMKYSKNRRISYAPTCFMLCNVQVFYDIGFMDEKYFVYFDDTDFVRRAKKSRKKLFYLPITSIKHKESVSTGKHSDFSFRFLYRNRIYYASKYLKFWKLFYIKELIYDKIVRTFRMRKNKTQHEVIKNALREGFNLACAK